MQLAYKPNLDEALKYWRAYWAGEIIDRPCTCVRAWKTPGVYPSGPPGLNGFADWDSALWAFDAQAAAISWLGEAMPFMHLNFGPDQFAAWVGGDLRHSSVGDEGTSWSVPTIKDWDQDAKGIDRLQGEWWQKALDYYARAGEISDGKWLVGIADIHSNMDALSALRGPQDLCMDLHDMPEKIDAAMSTVRRAFTPCVEGLEKAGRMPGKGYIGWLPFYFEGRYAVLQCDFACMVSPEHFRRWVLPALEEESSYLEHAVYHYDGPDALVHLKDVLSISGIHSIQWVPGAGNPPVIEWMDLLKEMQNAGKGLYIGASVEEVKIYHKHLRPERVMYDVWCNSEQEAHELLSWLKANT